MSNDSFDFGNLDSSGADDLDFGFDDSSEFGGSFDTSGFGNSNSNDFSLDNSNDGSIPDDAFDGAFDNGDFTEQDADASSGINKKAIIAIIVGVVGFILILVVITSISKSANKRDDNINQVVTNSTQNKQPYVGGGDASSVINPGGNNGSTQVQQQQTQQTVVNTVVADQFNWTEITNTENVTYNEDHIRLTFTVTGIKHYARAVDASGTLVTKTTLTGSLSGMPGTYAIDIPYEQGVEIETRPDLGIGCTFDVAVLLGDYNGKKVIGDISTDMTKVGN